MAKKKYTAQELKDYFEQAIGTIIEGLEDAIAEDFEIACWDGCLDGAVWNKNIGNLAKMYVDAIFNDRNWAVVERKYKVKVDFSIEDKRKALEATIAKAKRELAELE